jgi:hypothetical protein
VYADDRPEVLVDPSGLGSVWSNSSCQPSGERTVPQRTTEIVLGTAVIPVGIGIGTLVALHGPTMIEASPLFGPWAPAVAVLGAAEVLAGMGIAGGAALAGGAVIERGICGR